MVEELKEESSVSGSVHRLRRKAHVRDFAGDGCIDLFFSLFLHLFSLFYVKLKGTSLDPCYFCLAFDLEHEQEHGVLLVLAMGR